MPRDGNASGGQKRGGGPVTVPVMKRNAISFVDSSIPYEQGVKKKSKAAYAEELRKQMEE